MISGHGNDIYNTADMVKADFSSNVLFSSMHPELKSYLLHNLDCLENYPDYMAGDLVKNICDFHDVNANQVIVTNGATEAFYLLAHLFKGKRSAICIPSFSEYEDAAKLYDHQISFVSKLDVNAQIHTDLLWLGNPNNPDGSVLLQNEIEALCANNKNTMFIVDEAYVDQCIGFESSLPLLSRYDNLILIRSLTKAFTIPGLRLGYILGHERILAELNSQRMPWSINSLSLKAGVFIMENYKKLISDKEKILTNSLKMQTLMSSIDGICIVNSQCNYFLVQLRKGKACELKEFLLQNYGLLIRDASNFRGLDDSYFRLSVGEEKDNQELLERIREWI